MSWKGFFEGIQDFAETILFAPFEALRFMELDSWWSSNMMSWLFLFIGFAAFFYWMKELAAVTPVVKKTEARFHILSWQRTITKFYRSKPISVRKYILSKEICSRF